MHTGPLQYKVYSRFSEIEEIRSEWERLADASFCNRAFASPEWFLASCRMRRRTPFVAVAMRGAKIVSLLPLALDDETGLAEFPHFGNDYNDILTSEEEIAATVELFNCVLMPQSGCRKITLSRLRPDSLCRKTIPFLAQYSQLQFDDREINVYKCTELPGSFDEYLASRSKMFRKNIKRIFRKLELNGLTLQQLQPGLFDPAELPTLLVTMATSRQKQRSFLKDEETRSFVSKVLPPLFVKGHLYAFVLFQNRQPIALDLCMRAARGLATWNGGFLNIAEPWSPGSALFAFGIRRAIEMGLREYDFGEGKEAYKNIWTNSSYVVSELQLLPRARRAAADDWSADSIQPGCAIST